MSRRTLALLAYALMMSLSRSTGTAGEPSPDLIVHAGRIWTGDAQRPYAPSLAARGGRIIALGSRAEIDRLRGAGTRVVDLPGGFVTPGLIDAHAHLTMLGETREQVDLRGAGSIDEVVRRVRERADRLPAGAWVLGFNWDQSLWPGKELPTHELLTRALPDRPVWLRRVDGHACWANAAAMAVAGVGPETPDPEAGKILRDASGRPTGVFLDAANNLVGRHIPAPTREAVRRRLLEAQSECLAAGLSGVHDAALDAREIDVLRELDQQRALRLRVYGMALPPGGRELEFVSQSPGSAGDRFVLRAIKMFMDGAMGSRGGLLFEPYSDDPGNRGLLLTDPERLESITEAALGSGWQVCTHAIGDRGNRLVLDAYEAALRKVPTRDARLRIEHAQVVALEDIPRFARLGVIASMQPTHATSDKRWAEARVGPARIAGAYAWRRFLDAGARLAFGSDFPVEQVPPALGLYAAVTRQDRDGEPPGGWLPDQRITLDEALGAFTAGSAFAEFAETRRGVLRAGMECDLTLFDRDLAKIPARALADARVLATVINGEVCYAAAAAAAPDR